MKMSIDPAVRETSSFRDPSGFLFYKDSSLYRQVNFSYKKKYDHFIAKGLYEHLISNGLLIPHEDMTEGFSGPNSAYKILKPEFIDFISYPYEWCFSQYKHAALLTLDVQKAALKFGMILKDASVYNVQFRNGKPIFIDTLSFELYESGAPWKAYRQFCQHFLAPLLLMSYKDIRFSQLMKVYIDGIPLDLASSVLPLKTKFRFSILTHIHLHARAQKHYSKKVEKPRLRKISKHALVAFIGNLYSLVRSLKWKPEGTEWSDYYLNTNYSETSSRSKKKIVTGFLQVIPGVKSTWDLGSNSGEFSRITSKMDIKTISFDIDPAAVEINYLKNLDENNMLILPLLCDLTNPSPDIGWGNQERTSLINRGPVDTVLALALVHHLAISNNIPLFDISSLFSKLSRYLIIEFVPKEDSKVKYLLSTREDIFDKYNIENFEKEFSLFYRILNKQKVSDSVRTIYLMERKAQFEKH